MPAALIIPNARGPVLITLSLIIGATVHIKIK